MATTSSSAAGPAGTPLPPQRPCYVCCKSDQNELEYGEFLTKGQLSVHYFCLVSVVRHRYIIVCIVPTSAAQRFRLFYSIFAQLFSTDLEQHCRTDAGGFRRFSIADIKRLHRRTRTHKCCHCARGHATIRCAQPTCPKTFHFACGLRADALPQFADAYAMYCAAHVPADLHQPDNYALAAQQPCAVCLQPLPDRYAVQRCVPSCCRRGWFHTECVRRFAAAAGYYMSCLLCRQTERYVERVRLLGVYVPEREAAWEHRDNAAVAALRWRHSRCDVEPRCLNAEGRESRAATGRWQMWLCQVCAAFGAHEACARSAAASVAVDGVGVVLGAKQFVCAPCVETLARRTARLETAELEPLALADRTLYADDDDEFNCAQFLFGDDSEEELEAGDCVEDADRRKATTAAAAADDEVIEISSGSVSLRQSDSYSRYNEKQAAAGVVPEQVPLSPTFTGWLAFLDMKHSDLSKRKFRLRLLLGRDFPLDRRIRM